MSFTTLLTAHCADSRVVKDIVLMSSGRPARCSASREGEMGRERATDETSTPPLRRGLGRAPPPIHPSMHFSSFPPTAPPPRGEFGGGRRDGGAARGGSRVGVGADQVGGALVRVDEVRAREEVPPAAQVLHQPPRRRRPHRPPHALPHRHALVRDVGLHVVAEHARAARQLRDRHLRPRGTVRPRRGILCYSGRSWAGSAP